MWPQCSLMWGEGGGARLATFKHKRFAISLFVTFSES